MTEAVIETTAARWAPALIQRRKALVQRFGMGAATAMIFAHLFGWQVSMGWMACYFAVQFLDLVVFAPILAGRPERMSRLRLGFGAIVLFLNAAIFGSLSVLLWLLGGITGGVCASIVLASGAIYAVINSPRSGVVLALTLAPHTIYIAMMPVFMAVNGARSTFVTAASISVVVFIAYCISTWRSMNQAYQAESLARLDAERRRAEAERAMSSRSAFLAAIAHDLRTPIGAILTGAVEMDRGAQDGSARANAALITDAGLMMKALLDNLLDHSKLDAGGMTVEAEDFNLRTLLAQTIRLWAGPVKAKGLALRVEGAHRIPDRVRGDPMRVRQVLNNLLSNALKFTDRGSITLRLNAWPDELSGHAVLIEVDDTGPGMTTEQMGRLFTPFDQTADGISATHGGTGLGLAISRDLTHLMGGRLTARSAPSQGANFTLSLVFGAALNPPVATSGLDGERRADVSRSLQSSIRAMPTPRLAPTPVPATAPAPVVVVAEPVPVVDATPSAPQDDVGEDRLLRVLVVDDHDINRRAVELILAPLGCDIATAADGMIALGLCETKAFDVIFMDVRMPELDGREATRRLRASGGINADIPVIAVTADSAPEDIDACMAAGMTYFVSKPLTPPALLGALQRVLSDAQGAQDDEVAATAAA